ncbi:hypothetical protein CF319_g6943 [Tilletia indica]|nr:hypothetical protein CF319_g6943 [Tilletia indica]
MTEAVAPADAQTLLDAEAAAIDAVANFRWTDMRIDEFGSQIDDLSPLSQEMARQLRDVADCLNEPDLVPTAFDKQPKFVHPESRSRFEVLGSSTSMDEYLKLTQSTQSQGRSQNSSILAPPSNQQQLLSPSFRSATLRRSPRPDRAPSTSLSKNFVVEVDNTAQKRSMPSFAFGHTKTIYPSSSSEEQEPEEEEEDNFSSPTKKPPKRARQSKDASTASKPVASSSKGKEKAATTTTSSKGKGKATSSRGKGKASTASATSSATSLKRKRSRKIAPATGEEQEQMNMSDHDSDLSSSEEEKDAMASPQLTSRTSPRRSPRQIKLRASTGSSSVVREKRAEGGASMSRAGAVSDEPSTPKTPERSKPKSSSSFENGIKISKPARRSRAGIPSEKGYYGFTYLETFKENGVFKEKWRCGKCGHPKVASRQGHSTNLSSHRGKCIGTLESTMDPSASQVSLASTTAGGSTLVSTSYRGGSVSGWLNGCQIINPSLTRRYVLVDIIQNALPFTYPKSKSHVRVVKSIDARSVTALKSGSQVRRDLDKLYKSLKTNIKNELKGIDTLLALQHDAWTNIGFQHSFVAIVASYVNENWEYREILVSFDVIKKKHTGATFSSRLVRTVLQYGIEDKWVGTVTSDSAGTNHRMMDLLEFQVADKGLQERHPTIGRSNAKKTNSPSAYPRASQRHSGTWTAQENKILCMNHHINLAIRAGFKTFGVAVQAKTQKKVLQIRPAVSVKVTDEHGNETNPLSSDEYDTDADEDDDEAGDTGEEDNDGGDEDDGDGETAEGEAMDADEAEEDDYEIGFAPSDDDLISDDGGGPGAEDDPLSLPRKPKTAIGMLEAFCIAFRRSSQRRASFRACIEKEYHRNPEKAAAPFPPKPNATRWNSHFAMIQGAIKIREAIDSHCRAHIGSKTEKFGQYLLSDDQWRLLEDLVPLLNLAQDVTKDMEAKSGTLCMLLDNHATLRHEIDSMKKKLPTRNDFDAAIKAELQAFLDAVADKLKYYRDLALDNRPTIIACILHPNNRLKVFKSQYPAHVKKAEQHLRDVMAEMFGDTSTPPPQTLKSNAKEKKKSVLLAARARREQDSARDAMTQDEEDDEVTKYLDPKIAPWRDTDESPLKWWKDNEILFPTLAKVARIVLAIPGSSSSVERVFSQAARFCTPKRSRLSAATISRLVTTKHWLHEGFDPLTGLEPDAIRAAEAIAKLPDLD